MFNQFSRAATPVNPDRTGPEFKLARVLAEWASARDQEDPMGFGDAVGVVHVRGAGVFHFTSGDAEALRRALLG